jgi:hypothetical protein
MSSCRYKLTHPASEKRFCRGLCTQEGHSASYCYFGCYFSTKPAIFICGGRGGIRTHGGFPHARFRVECLKPDSATLPSVLKKRRTPNVEHPILNATVFQIERSAFRADVCIQAVRLVRSTRRQRPGGRLANRRARQVGQKCYNFRLAKSANLTASCMSTRTATLLLVVDRYSQVLGAAVHQY